MATYKHLLENIREDKYLKDIVIVVVTIKKETILKKHFVKSVVLWHNIKCNWTLIILMAIIKMRMFQTYKHCAPTAID